jgi:hypothetical protein
MPVKLMPVPHGISSFAGAFYTAASSGVKVCFDVSLEQFRLAV